MQAAPMRRRKTSRRTLCLSSVVIGLATRLAVAGCWYVRPDEQAEEEVVLPRFHMMNFKRTSTAYTMRCTHTPCSWRHNKRLMELEVGRAWCRARVCQCV